MLASVSSGEARRRLVDGVPARAEDDLRRPAVSVFMPDRLALVKGPPSPRRAHLDRLAAALRPARAELRRAYGRALAQRNSLIGRVRRGADPATARRLGPRAGRARRRRWSRRARTPRRSSSGRSPTRPRRSASRAGRASPTGRGPGTSTLEGILAELAARREGDLARGYTGYGPHRDEVEISFGGRSLRRYGSQGQQRLGLLALLFAEREALRDARRQLPLMLLDDVMSELDPERRERLAELLGAGGQALITATEPSHVPATSAPAASWRSPAGWREPTSEPGREPAPGVARRPAAPRRSARPAGLRERAADPPGRGPGRLAARLRRGDRRQLGAGRRARGAPSRSPARAAPGRRSWS